MRQTTKFGGLLPCIFRHNVGPSVHLLFILRSSNAITLFLETFLQLFPTAFAFNNAMLGWIKIDFKTFKIIVLRRTASQKVCKNTKFTILLAAINAV